MTGRYQERMDLCREMAQIARQVPGIVGACVEGPFHDEMSDIDMCVVYDEQVTSKFNIRGFFCLIVTRDVASMYHGVENIPLLPFHEQRAKLYECVIGVTKLDPKAVVCVGDSVGELEPAKRMRMTTIGVLSGIGGRKDLEGVSDLIVQDITEVSEALSRLDCSYT